MKPWKLAAIGALALALRLWHLGAKSLWLDEGVSIGTVRMPWHEFFPMMAREANMWLFYFFLRAWATIVNSEFWLRFPFAVFGSAAVVLFMVFVRKILGEKTAIITGVLLSVSVLHIRQSRELRSYGLLMFMLSLSWLAFERAVRRGKRGDLIVWAVVAALAIYTHLFAGFVILSQVCCLVFAGLTRERIVQFAVACLLIAVLITPLAYCVVHVPAVPIAWIPPLSPHVFHMAALDFANGSTAVIGISMGLLLLSLFHLVLEKGDERWGIAIALTGAVVPIVVTALVSLSQPAFISRYLIVALPCFMLALAIPIARLPKSVEALAVLIIVLLSAPSLREFYREPAWTDFRAAADYIGLHAQPNDVLLIWEPVARPGIEYYAAKYPNFPAIVFPGNPGPLKVAYLDDRPDVKAIDAISLAHPRVWVYYTSAAEPRQYSVWMTFFARRMSEHHRLASRFTSPPGAQVLEFVRP